ncbi:MAG: hypothetical protein SR1Q5_10495 [Quinella sp. 1Q5]|nr:hypothetical protein [Quinella sp. 1Q5]
MEKLLVAGVMFLVSMFACTMTCKIDTGWNFSNDEDSQNKEVKNWTPLGIGVAATIISSYLISLSDLTYDGQPVSEFIMNTVIFGVLEIISFAIIFYIAYGIMSAAKVSGNDEKARRNSAGWVTVVLNILLTLVALKQGI